MTVGGEEWVGGPIEKELFVGTWDPPVRVVEVPVEEITNDRVVVTTT